MRTKAYIAEFFLLGHLVLSLYVNSSFLSSLMGPNRLGLVYALASALAVISLLLLPPIIRKIGLIRCTLIFGLLNLLVIIPLITGAATALVIAAFLSYYVLGFLLRFNLDLYLESLSDDAHTGTIRGWFLTSANLAWIISPILAGLLVGNNNFSRIYLASAIAFIPFLLIISRLQEPTTETNRPIRPPLRATLAKLWRGATSAGDLNRILTIEFLLYLFYAVMVIYLPLHLHQTIGLDWGVIGVVLAVMLLPFLLLELPLGIVADKWLGEKEILTGGLMVAGLASLAVPWLSSSSALLWAVLLFISRIGASAVEIMKETYLFKKIGPHDTEVLSLSRASLPFAFLITPLAALGLNLFLPLIHVFTVVGVLLILGTAASLRLTDTR